VLHDGHTAVHVASAPGVARCGSDRLSDGAWRWGPSGYMSFRRKEELESDQPSDRLATRLNMEGSYPHLTGRKSYRVYNVAGGFSRCCSRGCSPDCWASAPGLTMPVMLGVLIGAFSCAKLSMAVPVKPLRIFFSFIIFIMAVEMIYSGMAGRL
jgi:hypothetical protein